MSRLPAVWITGARTGIGRALTRAFTEDSWHVVASSRSAFPRGAANERLVDVPMDVRDERSVEKAWKRIHRSGFDVSVLVNNAGVTAFRSFDRTSVEDFRAIIETNLLGSFLATRVVLPEMKRRRRGLIVNILSYAAKAVYTQSSAYAASKAGTDMLMRVLREEMRPYGVRVVNVYPGATETPMWSPRFRKMRGRDMMPVEDVARQVVHLVRMPPSVVPEELVLRPPVGDLTV